MKSIKNIFKTGFGPSSSHTMGPSIAGGIFLRDNPGADSFECELFGSLAATGIGHRTDMALKSVFEPKTVEIIWSREKCLPLHSNGMRFRAFTRGQETDSWEVYSIGGGNLRDSEGRIKINEDIYPHHKLADIISYCEKNGKSLWEYVIEFEGEGILACMSQIWNIMQDCIKAGIDREGVLPGPLAVPRKASAYYIKAMNSKGTVKNVGLRCAYALAVSEENASGSRVVTAPTCGSSGVLPALLYYFKKEIKTPEARIIRGLATSGLIGNLVVANASVSGAEVGCQGEIGTACAMAAAAASQLMGGSNRQIEYASEMGFEHNLGLTCDPIEGYVQIPCIERNAIACCKALDLAVYSLFSDGGHKVSFDRVVDIMAQTGRDLQSAYKETGIGGLAGSWKKF